MASDVGAVMPDDTGQYVQEGVQVAPFVAQLRALGPGRIIAVGLILLGFLAFLSFLAMRAMQPSYTLLFSGLALDDSQAVVQRLDGLGIPYRLSRNGDAVMVPDSDVLRLRMTLAEEGLPGGSVVGYEIFDQGDAFGTTDFLSNVKLKRALEGELARTIGSLRQIRSARVHLVQPQRQLFEREHAEPTASVFLAMRNGHKLGPTEISSIRHLVAAAVPSLSPQRVTVMDDAGNLLARGDDDSSMAVALDETESFRRSQEERIKQKIVQLLERSVGLGRVDAEVNLQMAFDEVSTTQELFDPESQVARSTQSVEESNNANETSPQNTVGVAGNLPTAAGQGGNQATNNEAGARTEETVNYEISRTIRNETRRGGTIQRMSIAVQVDGLYTTGADGSTAFAPRGADELQQLETLIRTAAGVDDDRGDTVSVISRQLVSEAPPVELDEPLLDLSTSDYMRLAEIGGIGIVALLVILLGVKPALNRLLPKDLKSLSKQAASVLIGKDGRPLLVHEASGATIGIDEQGNPVIVRDGKPVPAAVGEEVAPVEEEAPDESDEERININQIDGTIRASLLNGVTDVIDNRPDDAIRVIRGWLQME